MDIRPIGNNNVQPATTLGEKNIPITESTAAAKSVAPPAETVAAVQQPTSIPSMPQVAQAVKRINKMMESLGQSLEFSVDSDSQRTVVKVVDQETREVIRQMPTEEALQIAKALDQVSGLLIKQKA